jgi:hypothetical protein
VLAKQHTFLANEQAAVGRQVFRSWELGQVGRRQVGSAVTFAVVPQHANRAAGMLRSGELVSDRFPGGERFRFGGRTFVRHSHGGSQLERPENRVDDVATHIA